MPRDFMQRARIDGRAADARDLRLRAPKRDLNGNLVGGSDQLTGGSVNFPARTADPLKPAMGAGMAWLKAQAAMKAAREDAPRAAVAAGNLVSSAMGGASLGVPTVLGPGAGARGGGETSTALPRRVSAPAPQPDYRNDVTAGVTKYGFVGRAAEVRNRILDMPGATTADERLALTPQVAGRNQATTSAYLAAMQRAQQAGASSVQREATRGMGVDIEADMAKARADEAAAAATAARPALASAGFATRAPMGAPVVNEGAGGRAVVTRQAMPDFRKRSRNVARF